MTGINQKGFSVYADQRHCVRKTAAFTCRFTYEDPAHKQGQASDAAETTIVA